VSCLPGYFSDSSLEACTSCLNGTFSSQAAATSCMYWQNCSLGYYEALRPSSTSDRSCLQYNACRDYPCSVFSSGNCTDLPPPALNSYSGRTCGDCLPGYSAQMDTCIDNILILPDCSCEAELGWYSVGCGFNDTRLCLNGLVGSETRLCNASGIWQPPVSSCSIASSACSLYACDVNVQGCELTGQATNSSSDRLCGPCRVGFRQSGDICIDVLLQSVVKEVLSVGNINNYLSSVQKSLSTRVTLNQASVTSIFTLTLSLATVSA
jgi:hypothetical protein